MHAELAAQRVLISSLIRVMQQRLATEQASLDALQAAVQNRGALPTALPPSNSDGKSAFPTPATPKLTKPAQGTVTGTVKVKGGEVAWVYLADTTSSGGGRASMRQQGKSFVPGAIMVAKGARVEFPNNDPVFHNVFSDASGNSFDLGSYPQGESRTLTLTQVGQVDVLCNLHSFMRGYVFVAPNTHFVKVGSNGKFSLAKLPTGKHRIGVWTPNAEPVIKDVRIGAGEATAVDFEITAGPPVRHARKDGTPYGSYDE